jgi:hypothetical protein
MHFVQCQDRTHQKNSNGDQSGNRRDLLQNASHRSLGRGVTDNPNHSNKARQRQRKRALRPSEPPWQMKRRRDYFGRFECGEPSPAEHAHQWAQRQHAERPATEDDVFRCLRAMAIVTSHVPAIAVPLKIMPTSVLR